jgi:anhydro-N-acetylmuramic acid kinase
VTAEIYAGLMSGTSLDGIDAALVEFDSAGTPRLRHTSYLAYDDDLRTRLLDLHEPHHGELAHAAETGNQIADLYAQQINRLLDETSFAPAQITAIGCHGQTIRHQPAAGYTLQLVNLARLAERTGITVIGDFRSRDIAAGGQGAPLVPAFHAQTLRSPSTHRVIANIGGIANLTDLPPTGKVIGYDCGPGNLLLDAWMHQHTGKHFDAGGLWAARGNVLPELLDAMLAQPYFAQPIPKSAGREDFSTHWLRGFLHGDESPSDVQATLLELTVRSISVAVATDCPGTTELYVCGGGARNTHMMRRLREYNPHLLTDTTDSLGLPPDWLEAIAFAWLARQHILGQPGNLPSATGARGERVLGACYPA